MTDKENPDPLLNEKQAARYINRSPKTLSKWRTTKRYPLNFIKIGRTVSYRQSDLDNLLDQSLVVIPRD